MKRVLATALAILFCVGLLLTTHPSNVGAQQFANNRYLYISTATTTTVKAQSGFLHSVTINGGTAGVVTLFDIGSAGCTGTPGSGKFATIEVISATNPTTLTYNLMTNNGLCVLTAAATDLTVTFN